MKWPPTLQVRPDGTLRYDDAAQAPLLAGHAGRYVVHDGPPGVLLLERIEATEGEAPRERLVGYGEITGPTTVPDTLQALTASGWDGTLVVVSDGERRQLRLSGGFLTSAKSSVFSERLGEIMVREGAIDGDELEQCLEVAGATRRLGEAVVLAGLMDPEELFGMLKTQARCIFEAALLIDHGYYMCTQPPREAHPPAMAVHLPVQELLLTTMQHLDEMALLRKTIPHGSLRPVATEAAARIALDPELQPVAALCAGDASVRDITHHLGLDELTVTKQVARLVDLGYVELAGAGGRDRSRVTAMVQRLNAILHRIRHTVDAHGRADDMAWTFGEWVKDTTLTRYFGAPPDADGDISSSLTFEALERLHVDDPVGALQRAAIELVSFALFAASPGLPPEVERELNGWVNAQVRLLSS